MMVEAKPPIIRKSEDAEIEEAAIAPLDVEAERDQCIGGGLDHQPGRERRAHDQADANDDDDRTRRRIGPPGGS